MRDQRSADVNVNPEDDLHVDLPSGKRLSDADYLRYAGEADTDEVIAVPRLPFAVSVETYQEPRWPHLKRAIEVLIRVGHGSLSPDSLLTRRKSGT